MMKFDKNRYNQTFKVEMNTRRKYKSTQKLSKSAINANAVQLLTACQETTRCLAT